MVPGRGESPMAARAGDFESAGRIPIPGAKGYYLTASPEEVAMY